MAELKWEQKRKLNFTKLLEQIEDVSKTIINREISGLGQKIETLNRMGLIKDQKTMNELRKKMAEINIEAKQ